MDSLQAPSRSCVFLTQPCLSSAPSLPHPSLSHGPGVKSQRGNHCKANKALESVERGQRQRWEKLTIPSAREDNETKQSLLWDGDFFREEGRRLDREWGEFPSIPHPIQHSNNSLEAKKLFHIQRSRFGAENKILERLIPSAGS